MGLSDEDVPLSPRTRSSDLMPVADLPLVQSPSSPLSSPIAPTLIGTPTELKKPRKKHRRPPKSSLPFLANLRSSSGPGSRGEGGTGDDTISKTAFSSLTQTSSILPHAFASVSNASIPTVPASHVPVSAPISHRNSNRPSTAPSSSRPSPSLGLDSDLDYAPPAPPLPFSRVASITTFGDFFLILGHLQEGSYTLRFEKLASVPPANTKSKNPASMRIKRRVSFLSSSSSPLSNNQQSQMRVELETVKLVAQVSTKKLTSVFGVVKEWDQGDISNGTLNFSIESFEFPLEYTLEGSVRPDSLQRSITVTLSRLDPLTFLFDDADNLPQPLTPLEFSPQSSSSSRRAKFSKIMNNSLNRLFHKRTFSESRI